MRDQTSEDALLRWASSHLSGALPLGQEIFANRIMNGFSADLIGGTPDADMRRGHGARIPWRELVDRIASDAPQGLLVVEMPLSQPSDPAPHGSRLITLEGAEEVYAACRVDQGYAAIEEALRANDPSSMYAAAVLGAPQDGRPTVRIRNDNYRVSAVLVGAQDGEAIVYCSCTQP